MTRGASLEVPVDRALLTRRRGLGSGAWVRDLGFGSWGQGDQVESLTLSRPLPASPPIPPTFPTDLRTAGPRWLTRTDGREGYLERRPERDRRVRSAGRPGPEPTRHERVAAADRGSVWLTAGTSTTHGLWRTGPELLPGLWGVDKSRAVGEPAESRRDCSLVAQT